MTGAGALQRLLPPYLVTFSHQAAQRRHKAHPGGDVIRGAIPAQGSWTQLRAHWLCCLWPGAWLRAPRDGRLGLGPGLNSTLWLQARQKQVAGVQRVSQGLQARQKQVVGVQQASWRRRAPGNPESGQPAWVWLRRHEQDCLLAHLRQKLRSGMPLVAASSAAGRAGGADVRWGEGGTHMRTAAQTILPAMKRMKTPASPRDANWRLAHRSACRTACGTFFGGELRRAPRRRWLWCASRRPQCRPRRPGG